MTYMLMIPTSTSLAQTSPGSHTYVSIDLQDIDSFIQLIFAVPGTVLGTGYTMVHTNRHGTQSTQSLTSQLVV